MSSKLQDNLFILPPIKNLFMARHFISINKSESLTWLQCYIHNCSSIDLIVQITFLMKLWCYIIACRSIQCCCLKINLVFPFMSAPCRFSNCGEFKLMQQIEIASQITCITASWLLTMLVSFCELAATALVSPSWPPVGCWGITEPAPPTTTTQPAKWPDLSQTICSHPNEIENCLKNGER